MIVTKRFEFCYSHQLMNPKWDEKTNQGVFGKCYRLHGHNSILDVSIEGKVNPDDGMVVNFTVIKDVVKSRVVDVYDHRHMNEFVKLPTAENIVKVFWHILEPEFAQKGLKLSKLVLYETPTSSVEYNGGK